MEGATNNVIVEIRGRNVYTIFTMDGYKLELVVYFLWKANMVSILFLNSLYLMGKVQCVSFERYTKQSCEITTKVGNIKYQSDHIGSNVDKWWLFVSKLGLYLGGIESSGIYDGNAINEAKLFKSWSIGQW